MRRSCSFSSARCAGFTLLEFSLVLAGVAGVMALAGTYFSTSRGHARGYEFVAAFQQIRQAVETAWPTNDYTGLSAAAVLPQISANQALSAGGSLRAPNGQAITVVPVSITDRLPNSSYEVRFPAVERGSCVQLVQGLAPELSYVRAGSRVLIDRLSGVTGYTPALLMAGCTEAPVLVRLRP